MLQVCIKYMHEANSVSVVDPVAVVSAAPAPISNVSASSGNQHKLRPTPLFLHEANKMKFASLNQSAAPNAALARSLYVCLSLSFSKE